jgi:hypothetical protein
MGAQQVSVLLHLVGDEPVEVVARGDEYIEPGRTDVVFCYLRFATGITAHLHLSALDPLKLQKLTAVGSKRSAVFDNIEPERKLTIYPTPGRRAVGGPNRADVVSPAIDEGDPLRLACERFLAAVCSSVDIAGAHHGPAVVRTLEALQDSLAQGREHAPSAAAREASRVIALPRLPR